MNLNSPLQFRLNRQRSANFVEVQGCLNHLLSYVTPAWVLLSKHNKHTQCNLK